jgi:adenosylmethionine-8-amino-7-oxononanoate aminotransferase
MSSVLYRSVSAKYPVVAKASGMYLTDQGGASYLDMSGGAAVSCLGHGNRQVIDAITAQLETTEFAHTAFFTSPPQEALAERLVQRFGDPGARCYFTSGGSEANETAIKMTWQYWAACGQMQRKIIISREHSYHGNTFGTLMVSGNEGRRRASAAPLPDWPRISPFYPYREQDADESMEDYAERAAHELDVAIRKAGPEYVAAFICEPVVGSSLGVVAADGGYLQRIRDICDKHHVLLILDEIMCGSGRTGTYFAHEHDGIKPDIVTLAKGIAAGYQSLAATLANSRVVSVLAGNGFAHGHTYVGHPVACAAGLAVQQVLDQQGLLERTQRIGQLFGTLLRERFSSHPNVGDIRGRGLFWGIELVADKSTKTGFADARHLPEQLRLSAMTQGLICYPGGISLDSKMVPHIMLAPPMILEQKHMLECMDKLDLVFSDCLALPIACTA